MKKLYEEYLDIREATGLMNCSHTHYAPRENLSGRISNGDRYDSGS